MSRKIELMGMAFAGILMAACTAPTMDISKEQDLSVFILNSQVAQTKDVVVIRNGENVLVRGTIKKLHKFLLPGHVDVVVLGPDGECLEQTKGTLTGYASKRGGEKSAKFSAPLQKLPPKGSEIQLHYHSPGHTHSPLI